MKIYGKRNDEFTPSEFGRAYHVDSSILSEIAKRVRKRKLDIWAEKTTGGHNGTGVSILIHFPESEGTLKISDHKLSFDGRGSYYNFCPKNSMMFNKIINVFEEMLADETKVCKEYEKMEEIK